MPTQHVGRPRVEGSFRRFDLTKMKMTRGQAVESSRIIGDQLAQLSGMDESFFPPLEIDVDYSRTSVEILRLLTDGTHSTQDVEDLLKFAFVEKILGLFDRIHPRRWSHQTIGESGGIELTF